MNWLKIEYDTDEILNVKAQQAVLKSMPKWNIEMMTISQHKVRKLE